MLGNARSLIIVIVLIQCFAFLTSLSADERPMATSEEVAVLGGGCFWCVEAVFESLKGVKDASSGYAGGKAASPTYEQVSSGRSGHVEVVKLTFDPAVIDFATILKVFFHTHDPTTMNKQGADVGTQYRSVIYYKSEAQKESATRVIDEVNKSKLWPNPIVTTVEPLGEFFTAEEYHQNYYVQNKSQPYCSIVIAPKMQKLWKEFPDLIDKSAKH